MDICAQVQLLLVCLSALLLYDLTCTYAFAGDLGFLHNGELYICGRSKDLIIIRGSNHYPQDIERSVEMGLFPHIRAGCTAAFSYPSPDGEERVAVIAEVINE